MEHKERLLARRREADGKRWSRGSKDLPELHVGMPVAIQNQTGNNPTKWDKTGIVLENNPHSQVKIKVDGSRRITRRNMQFVKPLNHGLKRQSMFTSSDITVKNDGKPNTVRAADDEMCTTGDVYPSETIDDHYEGLNGDEIISLGTDQFEDQVDTSDNSQNSCGQSVDSGEPTPQEISSTHHETPSATVLDRPRRAAKPNPKYSPDMYDLD